MQLTVNDIAATITFATNDELATKVRDLVAQLSKLPPARTGKKRSFERSGLTIKILLPVWNELLALKASEAHCAQLESELSQPTTAPVAEPEPSPELPAFNQDLYAELSRLTKKQLGLRLNSLGKSAPQRCTKSELIQELLSLT